MQNNIEVAVELGIGERTLSRLLTRNPELRPARRYGAAYAWTTAEKRRAREALAAIEAERKKQKTPA